MDLGISNKRALVIGASRGLGAATAQMLLNEGASVIAVSRNPSSIEQWAAELDSDAASRLASRRLDLAQLQSVDALCDELLSEGGVDILVNNSGGPPRSTAAEARREQWLGEFESMAVNLFHLTGRLLPPMIERRWGRVVTIGSSGIVQPIPALALSNGIRSAVATWSKTLAAEVAAYGVTVNVVLPGRIATDRVHLLDQLLADRSGVPIETIEMESAKSIPVGRYGTPAEFASMVAFLASEQASYVTGSMVRVDGGFIKAI